MGQKYKSLDSWREKNNTDTKSVQKERVGQLDSWNPQILHFESVRCEL